MLFVSLNGCKGIAFFLTSKTFWSFFWRKCKIFAKTSQKGGFSGKKGPFYAKSGTTFGKKQFRHPQTATNKINLFIAVFFQKREEFYQKNIKNNIISSRTPSVTHCLSHLLYFQNSHYFHQKTIYFTAIYLFYIKKDSKSYFLHTKSMIFLCF